MLHDDDTLKYLDIYQKENKKASGKFITKKNKSKAYQLPIIFLTTTIIIFSLLPSSVENNPIIGIWEQERKNEYSMKLVFEPEFLIINDRKEKQNVKYEINGDLIIVKPKIYGITGFLPAYKFTIIDKNTIQMNNIGIKTIYKKVE